MGILDKARQAAEEAAEATWAKAHATAGVLSDPTTAERAQRQLSTTGQHAKRGLGIARKSLSTAIDRIDPDILATIVIKATALQEKANRSLREKRSPYRITEIVISAAIPPNIQFSIGRIDDALEVLTGGAVDSSELVDLPGAINAPVLALDGSEIDVDDPPGD
jgi:hypothetical protein